MPGDEALCSRAATPRRDPSRKRDHPLRRYSDANANVKHSIEGKKSAPFRMLPPLHALAGSLDRWSSHAFADVMETLATHKQKDIRQLVCETSWDGKDTVRASCVV